MPLYSVTIKFKDRNGKSRSWTGRVNAKSDMDAAADAGAQIRARPSVSHIVDVWAEPLSGPVADPQEAAGETTPTLAWMAAAGIIGLAGWLLWAIQASGLF